VSELRVQRAPRIGGRLRVPSDKSLTHRAYMLGAIAREPSEVLMPLRGEDCEGTRHALEAMGLGVETIADGFRLVPAREWRQPASAIDCGNSGTTMRLMAGLIASRPLDVTMIGDASLSRRPMGRIATPLRAMGATIEGDTAPLRIIGGQLRGIRYESPVASAQIKSATLLAGLRADGTTAVIEPTASRDHTERMLRAMGASVQEYDEGGRHVAEVEPTDDLRGFQLRVPADISSAAFFMVAAALGGEIAFDDLSVNPTRTGILDVLAQVGVRVEVRGEWDELGEPVAEMVVAPGERRPFAIAGDLVPRLIDEIPVLAVLATQLEGVSTIRDARELRVKETDRIETVAAGLRAMGAKVETYDDGMAIEGPTPLLAATVDSTGDHRIGMAFAIAGLFAEGETVILNADHIATSYPSFAQDLHRISS